MSIDDREKINFVSTDSAPKRFAGFVSPWRAPLTIIGLLRHRVDTFVAHQHRTV